MTYYRFRVVGREARDISTVFNSALSRRGGKSLRKSRSALSPPGGHRSRAILGHHRFNLPAPGYIPSDLWTRQIYFRPPAGGKNGAALPRRSSPAIAPATTFIARDNPRRDGARLLLDFRRARASRCLITSESPSFSVKSRRASSHATFIVASFFFLFPFLV